MANTWPVVAVGAVIWRGPERVLLVRRGQPPLHGQWSIPGGRVEFGETLHSALLREIREETGLTIRIAGLIDTVDAIQRDEQGATLLHYVLIDFSAHWTAGEACAASDAAECAWLSPAEALERVRWRETRRIIRESAQQVWNLRL
jgi:8-oxo-dGTP diphosphatase